MGYSTVNLIHELAALELQMAGWWNGLTKMQIPGSHPGPHSIGIFILGNALHDSEICQTGQSLRIAWAGD